MERAVRFENDIGHTGWQPQMSNGLRLWHTSYHGEAWINEPTFVNDRPVLYMFKWQAVLTSRYNETYLNYREFREA